MAVITENLRSSAFIQLHGNGWSDIGECLIVYVSESVNDLFLVFVNIYKIRMYAHCQECGSQHIELQVCSVVYTRTVRETSLSPQTHARKYVRVAKRPAGLESRIWRNMIIAGR